MKQRINVAVEIQSRTVTRRAKFVDLLLEYATENSFVKRSLSSIGKTDSTKNYFRFKHVELNELNRILNLLDFIGGQQMILKT